MLRVARMIMLSFCLLPLSSATAEPLKVLLLGKQPDHPYGTHMYLFECNLLAKCLRESPDVEAIVSDGWPRDPKVLDGVDVIVSYSADAGSGLLSGRQKEEFERLMNSGVGFVALHWSTGAQKKEVGPRWQEILGAWFSLDFSRLNVTDSVLKRTNFTHPICRGWDDFPLHDEFYLDLRFQKIVTPIVTTTIDGIDYTLGWAYERPKGKTFGFVCGHFHEVFLNENYRRIALNAILWAGNREVPRNGAPSAITPEEGILPPEEKK